MRVLPKFQSTDAAFEDFEATLKQRVKAWLDERGATKHGGWGMAPGVLFCAAMVGGAYATLLWGHLPLALEYLVWAWMGIGFAFTAMIVGHDAAHGSLSSSERVNKSFAWAMELMGTSARNWRIEHNTLHHGYTNIPGADLNIEFPPPAGRIIRLHEGMPQHRLHRWQHVYVFLLYGLLSLSMHAKDLVLFAQKHPLTGRGPTAGELLQSFFGKVLHHSLLLVVPLYVLDRPAYQVLLGYVLMHVSASLLLSTLFQVAHLAGEVDVYYVQEGRTHVPRSWMEHQVRTTMNMSPGNKLTNFLTGGLSHQIEHHLFPGVCHVHYPGLSAVVARTCRDFGLPYHRKESVLEALSSHFRHLRVLGRTRSAEG